MPHWHFAGRRENAHTRAANTTRLRIPTVQSIEMPDLHDVKKPFNYQNNRPRHVPEKFFEGRIGALIIGRTLDDCLVKARQQLAELDKQREDLRFMIEMLEKEKT